MSCTSASTSEPGNPSGMLVVLRKWSKRALMALGTLFLLVLGWRSFDAIRSPALPPWLTHVPPEPDARQIDGYDWDAWMAAEEATFVDVRSMVASGLTPEEQKFSVRFDPEFRNDRVGPLAWNRSQVLNPEGEPRGAAVLLHGLTDSPYSLQHVAEHYRERGFVVVAIRLPGHGTVPAALTQVRWEDWMAAVRLAVRQVRTLAGDRVPLHIVGYSNGAALAMKYTMDSLEDDQLPRVSQLVLISPMIGITSMARFAGVLGWPAAYPPFAKAAWLGVELEYNPFKYNSFPVNAARQSSQLTRVVQEQLDALQAKGQLNQLPPTLTFQSLVDYTVDVRALISRLYARLPDNGSELVIFACGSSPFMKPGVCDVPTDLLPEAGRNYRYSVVSSGHEERVSAQGQRDSLDIAQTYPEGVYSLSHVALPFPADDAVYGTTGLGRIPPRGERGVLVVSSDSLMRMTWNPFFPLMLERIDATLPATSSPP
jgi:alpha-beta hydrolase superfamily lysophospholipase